MSSSSLPSALVSPLLTALASVAADAPALSLCEAAAPLPLAARSGSGDNGPFVVLDEAFAASCSAAAQLGDSLQLLHRAAHVATDAFARGGNAPALTDWESTGGAYFLSASDGRQVAVLKPEDEEP